MKANLISCAGGLACARPNPLLTGPAHAAPGAAHALPRPSSTAAAAEPARATRTAP
ncbi:hypothetical protein ACIRPH_10400 [Nocardiopsis sp. NPDC101807]|uniref:hypothetical protein n=1 Tax=Nocardiopsis sp. NPDC101807 TaxID=3364339 RepID=UPI0038223A0D